MFASPSIYPDEQEAYRIREEIGEDYLQEHLDFAIAVAKKAG